MLVESVKDATKAAFGQAREKVLEAQAKAKEIQERAQKKRRTDTGAQEGGSGGGSSELKDGPLKDGPALVPGGGSATGPAPESLAGSATVVPAAADTAQQAKIEAKKKEIEASAASILADHGAKAMAAAEAPSLG